MGETVLVLVVGRKVVPSVPHRRTGSVMGPAQPAAGAPTRPVTHGGM